MNKMKAAFSGLNKSTLLLAGLRSRSAYLLPWATAMSLIEVGSDRLAFRALRDGYMKRASLIPSERSRMANSYRYIADRYATGDRADLATAISQMAAEIAPASERSR